MKKLIALLLAAVMVLSLAACGGSSAPAATPDAPASDAPATSGKVDVSAMSVKEKAAAEAEIRLALSMMIDRNYIIENIAQGARPPLPPSFPLV